MQDFNDSVVNFNTYEDYLVNFIATDDLFYLETLNAARLIAEYGYRNSTGKTLTREEFNVKKEVLREIMNPSIKQHQMFSYDCKIEDSFLANLAERERPNRLGSLSTIIFLRDKKSSGFEVSCYIDFEHSLVQTREQEPGCRNWSDIFRSKTKLWPNSNDLGYFHWRNDVIRINESKNYSPRFDPVKGLIFLNRHDRKCIKPDALSDDIGYDSFRTVIHSTRYNHVVLYDHIVRKKN
ncbi:unnamed protein product [Diamesa hyperborea]